MKTWLKVNNGLSYSLFGSVWPFVNHSVDILHVYVMMHRLRKRNIHAANTIFDILDF